MQILKAVFGCLSFGVFWVVAVFPGMPCLPIGRTAGSMLGAVMMVALRVESPTEAYEAVDLSVLSLLFGTMVVSIYLERADMFDHLAKALSWKLRGGKDLMLRVCVVSALSSALFTNDTTCVVLTQFVVRICINNRLPPLPYLLALASSANIGSCATPIGNPQNLIISMRSHLSFASFLSRMFLPSFLGVLVNFLLLLLFYWKTLSPPPLLDHTSSVASLSSHRFSPSFLLSPSHGGPETAAEILCKASADSSPCSPDAELGGGGSPGPESSGELRTKTEIQETKDCVDTKNDCFSLPRREEEENEKDVKRKKKKQLSWKWWRTKGSAYLVTIGMLAALICGLDMSWTALAAAILLTILNFSDAGPTFEKVSYSLLVFFAGMFITVDGFNKTGIPTTFWKAMEPHANINRIDGLVVLSAAITLLSNVASNVPTGSFPGQNAPNPAPALAKYGFTHHGVFMLNLCAHAHFSCHHIYHKSQHRAVLLLGPRVAAFAAKSSEANVTKSWLILAWVSTVAGNLTLMGSAANLIVCEQAKKVPLHGVNLSFWMHLAFGIPTTLIVVAVGLPLIKS